MLSWQRDYCQGMLLRRLRTSWGGSPIMKKGSSLMQARSTHQIWWTILQGSQSRAKAWLWSLTVQWHHQGHCCWGTTSQRWPTSSIELVPRRTAFPGSWMAYMGGSSQVNGEGNSGSSTSAKREEREAKCSHVCDSWSYGVQSVCRESHHQPLSTDTLYIHPTMCPCLAQLTPICLFVFQWQTAYTLVLHVHANHQKPRTF